MRRKRGLCSRSDAETAAAEASGEGGDGPGETRRAAAEVVARQGEEMRRGEMERGDARRGAARRGDED